MLCGCYENMKIFVDVEINKGPRKKTKIVDSIKVKVLAKMEDVTIRLENDVREIAAMEVRHDLYKTETNSWK